jgi:hypothetical protein
LWYTYCEDNTLTGYTYSDFAENLDDMKNTSGYDFHLGTNLILWDSKKHPIVIISSEEAEYVATTTTTFHAV